MYCGSWNRPNNRPVTIQRRRNAQPRSKRLRQTAILGWRTRLWYGGGDHNVPTNCCADYDFGTLPA